MTMWWAPLISLPNQPGYLNVRAAQRHKLDQQLRAHVKTAPVVVDKWNARQISSKHAAVFWNCT